jgi:hypothetical protein
MSVLSKSVAHAVQTGARPLRIINREAIPMGIVRHLSRIELSDDSGASHRLGRFWAERPIVLVFIRHFG